jgi:glycolate oxidase iron-sulfur subunit
MNGLRRRGLKAMPAFHMVELLDASIRGVPAGELLRGDKASPVDAHWKA